MRSKTSNITEQSLSRAALLRTLNAHHDSLKPYWSVHGNGFIGDKALHLMVKQWALTRAGCTPNFREVLTMNFFDNFRKTGEFSTEERAVISSISQRFAGKPVLVRSSAYGDSKGIGQYGSFFVTNSDTEERNIAAMETAILEVVSTESSKSAIAYRKNAMLPDGIAVMVEPVIGQQYIEKNEDHEAFYGPLCGGIAYTSTSLGPGFIRFTRGLPTLAVHGDGFEVFVDDKRTTLRQTMSHTEHLLFSDPRLVAGASMDSWFHGELIRMKTGSLCASDTICTDLSAITLDWIFTKLRKLEEILGSPQYLEWVIHEDHGLHFIPVQIADVTKDNDFYEFPDVEKLLARASYVYGSGIKHCNSIVVINTAADISLLSEYNDNNSNYLLVYPSSLVNVRTFTYDTFSNASVLLECCDGQTCHAKRPENHFGNSLKESGKILLLSNSLDFSSIFPYGQLISRGAGTLQTYPLNTKITASQVQQKAIVELL